MEKYEKFFEVTSSVSNEQLLRNVIEMEEPKLKSTSHFTRINPMYALTTALVLIISIGAIGIYSLGGSKGNDLNDLVISPPLASAASTVKGGIAEAPEAEVLLSRMSEFYNRDINMIENTFDFDVALVDLYGDSVNMFVTFEFTPTGDFTFTKDGTYSLFAGAIPKEWGRGHFMSLTNKRACYEFDDGRTDVCGGMGMSSCIQMQIKDGKAYQTFNLNALGNTNSIHEDSCVIGNEITFYIEGLFTTTDHLCFKRPLEAQYPTPDISGIMEFTFMADYEPNEFFVTEISKEIKLYGEEDENIFTIENVKISDTSIYFNFTSDSLSRDFYITDRRGYITDRRGFENFDPEKIYDPMDYVLGKIQLRINGKEHWLLGDDGNSTLGDALLNGLGEGGYELVGFGEYNSNIGSSFYDPLFDITSIEAVIIDGEEYKITTS
jgi:hypothetical protein